MTYNELNEFILNYLEYDITGRAIMLTGGWGSGKSYYVKNTLKPFLEEKKHKCAIVSLYGLTNVSEISKAIYMELRTILKENNVETKKSRGNMIEKLSKSIKKGTESEAGNTTKVVGKIVGKTLINGLISKIGFEIGNISDDDIQKVYDSINLSGKLIVLEDIERTQIDILELLGYVNNMCENDGVKILLVTNENEIIQFEMVERKENKTTIVERKYSEKAKKYLKAKEKTISDTLVFNADTQQTLNSIIEKFKNDDLNKIKHSIITPDRSLYSVGITNYREVIVACQKSCGIYDYMKKHSISANDEFKKCVFIGMVYYLQRHIKEYDLQFESNTIFDSNLSGDKLYPLMKFCFDYYHSQILNEETIRSTIDEYKEYIIYVDKTGYDDPDLNILYNFYVYSEERVDAAITAIHDRLDNIEDISLTHYDRIVNYILKLKYDIDSENQFIDEIVRKIIENLKGRGNRFAKKHNLFTSTIIIHNDKGVQHFEEIKKKVFESLEYIPPKSNEPTNYNDLLATLVNEVRQHNPNELLERLQLNKFSTRISDFTSLALDDLRLILSQINYSELNEQSFNLLLSFKRSIEDLLKQTDMNLDRIQKYQLDLMIQIINKNIVIHIDKQ